MKTPGGLSANEQNGINQVLGFYGGSCKYSSGTLPNGKTYFNIEMSNSPALDSAVKIAELSIANIAILFYSDLKEERSKYSEIRTSIILDLGQKAEQKYPVAKLETVLSKMWVVKRIVELIRVGNFDALGELLNDKSDLITYNKNDLLTKIRNAEPSLGNIKEFIPYGFMFVKTDTKKEVLHIAGVLQRDKQNNEFSIDFDPESTKDEAIFLNYKL